MLGFILPVLAVIIGVAISYMVKENKSFSLKLLLSFSGAFLLAITLFELLPSVYSDLDFKLTGLLIMIGILIQIILEFFSKGVEHGHIHDSDELSVFPWALFISLCLHSLMEGLPINADNDIVYGVLVHKIPIATVLTTFLLKSQCGFTKTMLFLFVFALMTPLGTFLATKTDILQNALPYLNAVVIGIFFHISTIILFESDKGHSFNLSKLVSILLGIAVAYII